MNADQLGPEVRRKCVEFAVEARERVGGGEALQRDAEEKDVIERCEEEQAEHNQHRRQ